MKLLKVFKDVDFGFTEKPGELKLREASRAIVFNEKKEVAILFVSKKKFYKIPGGGIEAGEDKITALKREVKEEAGCEIEVLDEIGEIIEYRTHFNILQKSYCYLARVVGEPQLPRFEASELEDGFELEWMTIEKAEECLRSADTEEYLGKFMAARDLLFFEEAKKHI